MQGPLKPSSREKRGEPRRIESPSTNSKGWRVLAAFVLHLMVQWEPTSTRVDANALPYISKAKAVVPPRG